MLLTYAISQNFISESRYTFRSRTKHPTWSGYVIIIIWVFAVTGQSLHKGKTCNVKKSWINRPETLSFTLRLRIGARDIFDLRHNLNLTPSTANQLRRLSICFIHNHNWQKVIKICYYIFIAFVFYWNSSGINTWH